MTQQIFNSVPWYKKMELLRVAKGWSQREAAEKCLTNPKSYWNWEKGKVSFFKSRNGEVGTVRFRWIPEVQRSW